MSFRHKIRIVFFSIAVLAAAYVLIMGVSPTGHKAVVADFTGNNRFIDKVVPAERAMKLEGAYSIVGDPVYFSVYAPRRFNQAKLTVKYKDESQSPLIEAGVLLDKQAWNYDLKPVKNLTLESLLDQWNVINEDGVMLLQKNKEYPSIESFLAGLPQLDKIATYNYDLKTDYRMETGKTAGISSAFDVPLRGPFQFYAYSHGENQSFEFYFSDLNRNNGADDISLDAYKDGKLIKNLTLPDDGIDADTGEITRGNVLKLDLGRLKEGVYKIELRCGSDIVVEKILTDTEKLSFINKIWIADGAGNGIDVHTDSRVISAQTTNPGRLQTITVGTNILSVAETYKQYGIRTSGKISKVELEKDDIMLSGDGVFAFTRDGLFNPTVKKLNENSDMGKDGIEFIVARYVSPREEDGWKISEANFDISNAHREKGRYDFLVSAPRLGTESNQGRIIIDRIRVDLDGSNILEFIMNIFKD